jgi:hypothetical protein
LARYIELTGLVSHSFASIMKGGKSTRQAKMINRPLAQHDRSLYRLASLLVYDLAIIGAIVADSIETACLKRQYSRN